eukprot:Skav206205  [mRNA]  locus=scaffold1844:402003:407561:- [translate_table: standard]
MATSCHFPAELALEVQRGVRSQHKPARLWDLELGGLDSMEDHSAWLDIAASCVSDVQWDVLASRPAAVLSHRPCPWGGQLIKIDAKTLDTCTSNVFWTSSFRTPLKIPRLFSCGRRSVLFGHSRDDVQKHFFQEVSPVTRFALYRNFPDTGDCAYVATETISIARRSDHPSCSRYRLIFVFRTPEDTWSSGCCVQHFPAFTDMFQKKIEQIVNGPGFRDKRAIDAKMYLVLSMRGFNRGNPMVPETYPCSQDSFAMHAGVHLGLVHWARFKAGQKFQLSEYLHCFMQRLGHKLKTHNMLDGLKLVPYQCVVVRHEWNQLRASFFEAFKVQKAAYRHASGGTQTPTLNEDVPPRRLGVKESHSQGIKTVVRKTFVELDDIPKCRVKRSLSTGQMMTCCV